MIFRIRYDAKEIAYIIQYLKVIIDKKLAKIKLAFYK
jgi:hypothetical protein